MPALLTQISMPPRSFIPSSANRTTDPASATSSCVANTGTPCSLPIFAAASIAASASLSPIRTAAPASAKRRAAASPRPRAPPVIRALRPFREMSSANGGWQSSTIMKRNGSSWMLYPVQTVRGILHGKKDHVPFGRRRGAVHDIGGDIDRLPWLHQPALAFHGRIHRALEHINPLLVGVGMGDGAAAGGHAHERCDHALALDHAAEDVGIVGATHDRIHLRHVKIV